MRVYTAFDKNGKYAGYFTEGQTDAMDKWLAENPECEIRDGRIMCDRFNKTYLRNLSIPEQQAVIDKCTVSDLFLICRNWHYATVDSDGNFCRDLTLFGVYIDRLYNAMSKNKLK